MKDEEFLKEHPGLEGRGTLYNKFIGTHPEKDSTTYRFSNDWVAYCYELIHETQLDKQKVREVIDERIESNCDIETHGVLMAIKEKLGLQ